MKCFSRQEQGDLFSSFGAIAHKTQYVCGALDTKYVGIGKRLKESYPQMKLYIIHGLSHNVCSELNNYI